MDDIPNARCVVAKRKPDDIRLTSSSRLMRNSARSWLAVAGAAMALFCTVGYVNAFGVFQQYYLIYLPGRSPSDISWIGSLTTFLLYAISPFGGTLVDKIGPTIPLIVGSVGLVFALFMTSLCTEYWQIMLAQALLLGLSASLVFCPPLGVIQRHMPHRRGLVMGLAIGGSSVGGIVWPIMLQKLLIDDGVSFGWTIRAMGFIMIPLLAFACATVREPVATKPPGSSPGDKTGNESSDPETALANTQPSESIAARSSFFKKPTYILICTGLAFAWLGLLTPLFYVSNYAVSQGQKTSTAFYVLSGVNGASFLGRVLPGYLADSLGHLNLLVIFTLLSGVLAFVWTTATSLAGIVIWSLAFGFTSGAVLSLQGACVGKLAPTEAQGKAIGVLMGCLSISALVGAPIGGQILAHAGYLSLSMWTGAVTVVGGIILAVARFMADRRVVAVF